MNARADIRIDFTAITLLWLHHLQQLMDSDGLREAEIELFMQSIYLCFNRCACYQFIVESQTGVTYIHCTQSQKLCVAHLMTATIFRTNNGFHDEYFHYYIH